MPNIGQWIAPDGQDLTAITTDPFEVTIGSSYSPGSLQVTTPVENPSLTTAHEGVYSCVIPDDSGETRYLHIGIYLHGFSG